LSWLKTTRKRLGLKQADLAFALGLDQAQICRLERNQTALTVERFLQVCKILDLDPSEEVKNL